MARRCISYRIAIDVMVARIRAMATELAELVKIIEHFVWTENSADRYAETVSKMERVVEQLRLLANDIEKLLTIREAERND